jgi:hypothetical protein
MLYVLVLVQDAIRNTACWWLKQQIIFNGFGGWKSKSRVPTWFLVRAFLAYS